MSPRKRLQDDASKDLAAAVGRRIGARRRELGRTLKQVAGAAGLSHPFLSQVERGLARPSVPSLSRIAAALGTTSFALLAPEAEPVRLVQAGERPASRWAGAEGPGVVRQLTGQDGRLQVLEVVLYVADGCIEVDVAGKRYRLEPGGALVFDGRLPHSARVTGGADTRFLFIWAP